MLVLLGIEWILFVVAGVGLCFGFVLEAVLIIQGCFVRAEQGLHRAKTFSAPQPMVQEAGGAWEAGRGHSQDS